MKFTLNVPQSGIIDAGFDIDVVDGVILDFMISFSHSPKIQKIFDGDSCYYWFEYGNIIKEIPLLKMKKDAIYRRVKHMCDIGLLHANVENQRLGKTYFKIMPAAVGLYYKSDEPSVKKPNPSESNPDTPSVKKPDNNIIIDNNINDSKINDKKIIDSTPTPPAAPAVEVFEFQKGLILPWESDEFKHAWARWKEYKKGEHKFSYKTLLSEQAALNHVAKISEGDEQLAISTIFYSMSQSWKGIYLNRDAGKTNNKTGNGNSTVSAATTGGVVQNIVNRFNKAGKR